MVISDEYGGFEERMLGFFEVGLWRGNRVEVVVFLF